MKKGGTGNPVMMLDEIDKVGSDFRGDPTSALLEVLDPEQNDTFYDNYLELEYDLSKVLFIATANSLETVPAPLRDRMEIIKLSGYTLQEKLQIAKKYLIPKALDENGLNKKQFNLTDKAVEKLIESYTKESGVRNLFREIAGVIRGAAIKVASDEEEKVSVGINDVEEYRGKPKFFPEVAERTTVPGVATGLAWTPAGGDILFIEASVSPGTGKLHITGQLGDVMKESAVLALSYIKGNSNELDIPDEAFTHWDLHVHVPAGAIPKDGPSAGVSMLAAMTSIFTQRKVKSTMALTGEITLRGLVLPVGGIKEKVLAAKRAGIKEVLLPKKNEKDVTEIETDILGNLKVTYLERMDDLFGKILEKDSIKKPLDFTDVKDHSRSKVTSSANKEGHTESVVVDA
jgi:ATP-dependent Lon protease